MVTRTLTLLALAVLLSSGCGLAVQGDGPQTSEDSVETVDTSDVKMQETTVKAPDKFDVVFDTTKGKFTVSVDRRLSPRGADRFYDLVQKKFFDDVIFFRVVTDFVVQFGINGDPRTQAAWTDAVILDDPVKISNKIGTLTYAKTGLPNSRTTQLFINLADNSRLDNMGFAPFGQVTEGMDVVKSLYGGYGEVPSKKQPIIERQGNAFLKANYPKLDQIKTARLVKPEAEDNTEKQE